MDIYRDFYNQIFNNTSYQSGKIKLILPKVGEDDEKTSEEKEEITGLLTSDVSLNLGMEWGPILPKSEDVTDFMGLIGNKNIFSWVQSSAVFWKGTKPIEFKADFYLITLNREWLSDSQNIKLEAAKLARLASMHVGKGDKITGTVHGGYKVEFGTSNSSLAYFSSSGPNQAMLRKITDAEGTITAIIGDQFVIDHLLLEDLNITPSSVQVYSPYTNRGIPLYIKIEASFRTNRAPVSTDIDFILGNRPNSILGSTSPVKTVADEIKEAGKKDPTAYRAMSFQR